MQKNLMSLLISAIISGKGNKKKDALSNIMKTQHENRHDDDMAVLSRCRQGDPDAFEALVEKYQKQMLNIACRMTGSYEDACEVVQDAFVAAYRGLGDFGGRSRFSTWLVAIVMNLSRNRIRQMHGRNYQEGISLDDPVDTQGGNMRPEAASPHPDQLEELEEREEQERIQGCIKALDPDFREIIVLRDLQGFSYQEICGMLKIPEGTVKSRLSRARDAVKNCLKKVLGDN